MYDYRLPVLNRVSHFFILRICRFLFTTDEYIFLFKPVLPNMIFVNLSMLFSSQQLQCFSQFVLIWNITLHLIIHQTTQLQLQLVWLYLVSPQRATQTLSLSSATQALQRSSRHTAARSRQQYCYVAGSWETWYCLYWWVTKCIVSLLAVKLCSNNIW